MMDFVEQLVKEKGFKEVEVPSSITANGFYKKLGYKKFRTEHFDTVGDVVLMKKSLK